jgi:hypothetical protein
MSGRVQGVLRSEIIEIKFLITAYITNSYHNNWHVLFGTITNIKS